MKTTPVFALALLAMPLVAATGARAEEQRCNGVIADWQPRSALVKMAEDMGWTVSRIRADDGCYVIRGRDKDGREIRARVDPVSLKVLSTREGRRHRDDDEDDDESGGRERRDGRRGERPQAPTDSRPPTAEMPLTKGQPQGQIQ